VAGIDRNKCFSGGRFPPESLAGLDRNIQLGGVIANSMGSPYSAEIIDDFVAKTHTQIIEYIPRSITVTQSELQGKTTIEAAPTSKQADVYRSLAKKIAEHEISKVPTPLETTALREWAAKWGDYLLAAETGQITSQAAGI
jgi:nitrogenase iron protein NifH